MEPGLMFGGITGLITELELFIMLGPGSRDMELP